MFAAYGGIVRDVLVNIVSNGFQTCSDVAHPHQSLRKSFAAALPIFARLIAGSLSVGPGRFD